MLGLLVLSILVTIGISQYCSDESYADPAVTYTGGGVTYELYESDSGNTATAGWDGTSSEVTIEATVVQNDKTYYVNALNQFEENTIVTKVTIISNSQLVMSASTFKDNHALATVVLGEGIKELPDYFCADSNLHKSSLTSINLENVETIGACAFQRCDQLSSVNLSKTENIGASAFQSCTSLNSVILSPQLEIIGNYAFSDCNGLQSIALPGAILSSGTGAFTRCATLNDVSFDPAFKSIGEHMFENCIGLTSIDLKNVQGIGAAAFRFCTALTSISIPDTTKAIGDMAFDGCTSLASCDLGSGLESLGKLVFQNCPITGKMVLPASITSITVMDTGVPTFPMGLSEIEVDPANQFFASRDGILYDKGFNTILFCPREKTGEVTIAASVEEYAFAKCHLSKITILNGASTIGNAAFQAVDGEPTLEEIVFPDSLQSIGNYILKYQTNLKVIILPSNLGSLGGNLFNGLTGLEYIQFPDTSFTTTSAQSFNKVTFKLSDGTTVPKSTNGGTVSNLQGVRFVLNESVAATFNQIGDDQVLLTKVINGVASYKAISKGVPFESPKSPEAPVGLSFAGWYTDSDMTVKHDESTKVSTDLVLYAKFIPETHTVTYKVDGEVVGEVKTYDYGTELSVNSVYEKIGYTVSDWSCTGATLVEGKITIEGEDVVFTATSTVNQYTITFDTLGGSAVDAITQDYNSSVSAPSVEPSKDGYRFVMWTPELPATMPANDVILKAVWAIVATANADGKSVVTLDSETSSFIPAAETKEITVEIRENTAVKVEDASNLVGKTVVSKVEPVSNSTGVSGTAYEFTFTADGTQYNGKIQVTLPYTKEDGKEPVVYFWNGSESTKMNVVSSTDTSVTFETDHNSTYVVASEAPSKDAGSSLLLYIGILIVAGICAAVLIGFNFYHKKA